MLQQLGWWHLWFFEHITNYYANFSALLIITISREYHVIYESKMYRYYDVMMGDIPYKSES